MGGLIGEFVGGIPIFPSINHTSIDLNHYVRALLHRLFLSETSLQEPSYPN